MPVLDVYVLIGMYRMTFSEFACLHGKDERFKAIEKKREREAIFSEYVTDLKKSSREREMDRQHKESARSRTDKVCVVYTDDILLQISASLFSLFLPGPHNHYFFISSSPLYSISCFHLYLLHLFIFCLFVSIVLS